MDFTEEALQNKIVFLQQRNTKSNPKEIKKLLKHKRWK